jgi:hypothetical protein
MVFASPFRESSAPAANRRQRCPSRVTLAGNPSSREVGGSILRFENRCLRPLGHSSDCFVGQCMGQSPTLHGVFVTRERKRLDEMRPLLERGRVTPLVDKVLPLPAVREAHERLDSGHGRGRIVLPSPRDKERLTYPGVRRTRSRRDGRDLVRLARAGKTPACRSAHAHRRRILQSPRRNRALHRNAA